MQSYSRPLGDAVKRARAELGFTQNQVAEAADIDVRTVLDLLTKVPNTPFPWYN